MGPGAVSAIAIDIWTGPTHIPLPRGGPVSVPPPAVRVNAVLPRQAQNGHMSHDTLEGVGPRHRAFRRWQLLVRRDSRPVPSGIVSVALIAIAFLVAACGGASSPASVAHIGKGAPTTTVPPAAGSGGLPNLQQMYQSTLAYAGCMHSHGDPSFPDPELVDNADEHGITMGQGVDQSSPQYLSANKTCKHLLPNNGNGPTRGQLEQSMAQALKFSKCMRSHGVPSFPDPQESGQNIQIGGPGVDPSSPQFQAAQNDCRSLLPGGGL